MPDESMIAFLPDSAYWCKQEFPHLTLVYGGPIEGRDESELNEMAKDAISSARLIKSFSLQVTGVEEWGEDERVDVLTLYPIPQLLVARKLVEKWDTGDFPEYKPHVTIGPAGSAYDMNPPIDTNRYSPYESERRRTLPSTIYFDRLAICWGEKRLIFNLGDF